MKPSRSTTRTTMPATSRAAPSRAATSRAATARAATPRGTRAPGAAREDAPRGGDAPRRPLTAIAYDDIKGRILSLELRPGQFLNEATLCELTGLGRMPVHQAIHRLQAEGLIEVIPRKGLVVRSDSLNDVLELLEARMAIEPNAAALAAERIGKDRIGELRALLARSRGLIARNQRTAYRVLDRAFHVAVVEGAGNRILAATMRPLHDRSDLIWGLRVMPDEALGITQREHEAVLEAIVARDARAAHAAMQAHLTSLHKRVLAGSLHASPALASAPVRGRSTSAFEDRP